MPKGGCYCVTRTLHWRVLDSLVRMARWDGTGEEVFARGDAGSKAWRGGQALARVNYGLLREEGWMWALTDHVSLVFKQPLHAFYVVPIDNPTSFTVFCGEKRLNTGSKNLSRWFYPTRIPKDLIEVEDGHIQYETKFLGKCRLFRTQKTGVRWGTEMNVRILRTFPTPWEGVKLVDSNVRTTHTNYRYSQ